jgi:hypothetical protein
MNCLIGQNLGIHVGNDLISSGTAFWICVCFLVLIIDNV